MEEIERVILMWYQESAYRLKRTVVTPGHSRKSAWGGMHDFSLWVLILTGLSGLQTTEPKPLARRSWLWYSWAPEHLGGKRRATLRKKSCFWFIWLQRLTITPQGLWGATISWKKIILTSFPPKPFSKQTEQMRTRSSTAHLETLPAGVQREWKVDEGITQQYQAKFLASLNINLLFSSVIKT